MAGKLALILIILIAMIFGFAFGYAFKKVQSDDTEKAIMQKHCYKYGGWGCE